MAESLLSSYINGGGFDPRNPDSLLKACSYLYQDMYRLNTGAAGLPLAPGTGENSIIKTNGTGNTASGVDGIAIGDNCTASGHNSFAIGVNTIASGENSTAIGFNTTASASVSIAAGNGSTASGIGSLALGENSIASGEDSAVLGVFCVADASEALAQGVNTGAYGTGSHSEGEATNANGNNSHAEGVATTADGEVSHSEGDNTAAVGYASKSYGKNAVAIYDHSTAFASALLGQRMEVCLNNRTTDGFGNALYINYPTNTKELDFALMGVNIFWNVEMTVTGVDDGTGSAGVEGDMKGITTKFLVSSTEGNIVGTPVDIYNDGFGAGASWSVLPSVTGTKLQVIVQGEANKNINWTGYVSIVQVSY